MSDAPQGPHDPWAPPGPTFLPPTPAESPWAPPPPPQAGEPAAEPRAIKAEGRSRPLPHGASLLAAAGGLVASVGLQLILNEGDVAEDRAITILVAMVFTVVGAALVLLNRTRRAAAGGVALMALALVPLVQAIFQPDVESLFTDGDAYRNSQMATLACLAVLWLACWAFGPTRRYGVFLGAAALALWMVPMTFLSTTAATDTFDSIGSGLTSTPDAIGDPFDDDIGAIDDLGGLGQPDDALPLKLGLTSLFFGGAYLTVAALWDWSGDARAATPLFAVAPLILYQALVDLTDDLTAVGTGVLGIVLGSIGIWLGVRGRRRFTSWAGVAAVAFGLISAVVDVLDEAEPSTAGAILAFIGITAVLVVSFLEGRGLLPAFLLGGDRPEPTPAPSAGEGPGAG